MTANAIGVCTPTLTKPVFATLETAQLAVQFTVATAPVDPATVTFEVQDQAGAKTAYVYGDDEEVERTGPGAYSMQLPQFTAAGAGEWFWKASGEGATCEASFQDLSFRVTPSRFSAP